MMRRSLYAGLVGMVWLAACTTPPDPGTPSDYAVDCASVTCGEGATCDPDTGACVEDEPGLPCIDEDEDGYGVRCALGVDCDDGDYFTNPSVGESCDDLDNNCDGRINEGGVCDGCESQCTPGTRECLGDTGYRECFALNGCEQWKPTVYCDFGCEEGACVTPCDDFDRDGYGEGCAAGPDCDDRNPFAFPNNPEVCDGYDNDCDGTVDNGRVCDMTCPTLCTPGARACTDDLSAELRCFTQDDGCPAWVETLRCNAAIGEACLSGQCEAPTSCQRDDDLDGYGEGCQNGPDCNAFDPNVHPGAPELCDGIDNNCDGTIDEGLPTCAADACAAPHNTVATALDYSLTHPLGAFTCPGRATLIHLGSFPANTTLLVAASRDHILRPLTLELVRLNGDGTFSAVTEATGHAAMLRAPGNGELYARVTSTDSAPAPFIFNVANALPDRCVDVDENNGSPDSASPITADTVAAASTCAVDLDFLKLTDLPRYRIISADLLYLDPSREMTLELWRNGEAITPDQRVEPGRRHVHSRSDLSGDWSLFIQSTSAQPQRYILAVNAWAAATCEEDVFENNSVNDRLVGATPIIDNVDNAAVLCPGDLDWYDLGDYAAGQLIDVTINFNASQLNIDARLFHEDLRGLTQVALQDTAPEFLPINAPQAGRYYALVQGRTPSDTGPYTIHPLRR